jgi:hypothetical protein
VELLIYHGNVLKCCMSHTLSVIFCSTCQNCRN